MESISVTNARQDFYNLISNVSAHHQPVRINGKNGNAVLISEEDWDAIEETLLLNAIPGLVSSLKFSESESLDSMVDADDLDW